MADGAGRDARRRRDPAGSRRQTAGVAAPTPVPVERIAALVGVSTSTLRRWAREGLVPVEEDGSWSTRSLHRARIVQRLRLRGRSLAEIAEVTTRSSLALDYLGEVVTGTTEHVSIADVARETGLQVALVRRIAEAFGFSEDAIERMTPTDVELFRHVARALDAGYPLVALLQLARVYGQALGRVADAEVRMFRLYVRDPAVRDGGEPLAAAAELADLARVVRPLADPIIRHVHRRSLDWFIEQDAVSLVEQALDEETLLGRGRLRVAVAFADLAGYTRLTDEQGDEEAVEVVERFVDAVELSLPDDARILKTIGDEVMVIADDLAALVDWAVGFQALHPDEPRPRIGVHHGEVLFRDGDYFGREVNLAARVVARAGGGEVVVTEPVVAAAGAHLRFDPIGAVRLKGFREPTALYLADVAGGR
jgi:adenylate cyclase